MSRISDRLVGELRAASRSLVREFGFMDRRLAGTDLAPSAVHAIIEIGLQECGPANAGHAIKAGDLAERLLLEKSTISRLLKSLIDKRLVDERPCSADKRAKTLHLSAKGRRLRDEIDRFAERQVRAALSCRKPDERDTVLRGMELYAAALRCDRLGAGGNDSALSLQKAKRDYDIGSGYRPGLVGDIVAMHAQYYSRHAGFGAPFETKVASELAAFIERLGAGRSSIWWAEKDACVVGAIAVDGADLDDGSAHLRWFIVSDKARGTGLGRTLLRNALGFCDRHNFPQTKLWTFEGLDAARHLYEVSGFVLESSFDGRQWGRTVREQVFVRQLPESARA